MLFTISPNLIIWTIIYTYKSPAIFFVNPHSSLLDWTVLSLKKKIIKKKIEQLSVVGTIWVWVWVCQCVRLLVKNSAVQTISAQRTGTIKVDCMGSAKTNPLVQPCSAVGELTKLTHEVRCKTGQFHWSHQTVCTSTQTDWSFVV